MPLYTLTLIHSDEFSPGKADAFLVRADDESTARRLACAFSAIICGSHQMCWMDSDRSACTELDDLGKAEILLSSISPPAVDRSEKSAIM